MVPLIAEARKSFRKVVYVEIPDCSSLMAELVLLVAGSGQPTGTLRLSDEYNLLHALLTAITFHAVKK
jgi:hypothetical protein